MVCADATRHGHDTQPNQNNGDVFSVVAVSSVPFSSMT